MAPERYGLAFDFWWQFSNFVAEEQNRQIVKRLCVSIVSSRGRCQIHEFSVPSSFAAHMLSSELGNGVGVEHFQACACMSADGFMLMGWICCVWRMAFWQLVAWRVWFQICFLDGNLQIFGRWGAKKWNRKEILHEQRVSEGGVSNSAIFSPVRFCSAHAIYWVGQLMVCVVDAMELACRLEAFIDMLFALGSKIFGSNFLISYPRSKTCGNRAEIVI